MLGHEVQRLKRTSRESIWITAREYEEFSEADEAFATCFQRYKSAITLGMTIALSRATELDQVVRFTIPGSTYELLLASRGDDTHARLTHDGETLERRSPGARFTSSYQIGQPEPA